MWAHCLNADFKGNFFSFSLLTIMFTMVLSYLAFIMLRYVPPMTTLAEVFVFVFVFCFIKTLNFVEFKFEFFGGLASKLFVFPLVVVVVVVFLWLISDLTTL